MNIRNIPWNNILFATTAVALIGGAMTHAAARRDAIPAAGPKKVFLNITGDEKLGQDFWAMLFMKIRFGLSSALLLTLLTGGLPAAASPLFPCPSVASSEKGNFLAVIEYQYEPPDSEIVRKIMSAQSGPPQTIQVIRQTTIQVYSRETFINAKDRMTSPVRFWGGWNRWNVVLDAHNDRDRYFTGFCPLPLISDDGEFLVVLNARPVFDSEPALRIYRKILLGQGVRVREIPLKEIWPADKLGNHVWLDSTPAWFAGGTFEFSQDSKELIHTTRFGNTVRIGMADGVVYGLPVIHILPLINTGEGTDFVE